MEAEVASAHAECAEMMRAQTMLASALGRSCATKSTPVLADVGEGKPWIEVQTADFKAKAAVMDGEPLQEGSRAARELVSLARSASERKLFERTAGALPR